MVLAIFFWRRAPPFFVAFGFLIALDAWLNGGLTPLHEPHLKTAVAVLFVMLGDFRFFYLVDRKLRQAIGRTLIVPVIALPFALKLPESYVWMIYELGVLVVAAFFLRRKRALAAFEMAQYGLWLLADLVILLGHDVGWGIRVIPNFLYYVVFLPFAWKRA